MKCKQGFGMSWIALALATVAMLAGASVASALDRSVGSDGVNATVLRTGPAALNGSGVKLGILDEQIDTTTTYLNVAGNGGSGGVGAHPTEVAGVLGSSHPTYTGVAPAAKLYGYSVVNWEDTFTGTHWLVDQGASIITYPFGWELGDSDGLDGNSWETQHVDFVSRDKDVLFVITGNQSGGGYPLPTDTFNGITVNATVMTASGRYDQAAGWNNYTEAPTDGRGKPDLVAPGGYESLPERDPESIRTITTGGGLKDVSGTSYAAPHVAGVAALLTEYGQANGLSTHHNVLKAALLNSADKSVLDKAGLGWLLSEAMVDPEIPLDDELGAGQLAASAAYEQYRAGEQEAGDVSVVGWDKGVISGEDSYVDYVFDAPLAAGTYLTATLAWDRRVILEDDENADGRFDYLDTDWLTSFDLNDLDLLLYDEAGNKVVGSWSGVDNLEHLHWLVPADGLYTLSVGFFEELDLTDQGYAIAWSATAVPEPASLLLLATGALAACIRRRAKAGSRR